MQQEKISVWKTTSQTTPDAPQCTALHLTSNTRIQVCIQRKDWKMKQRTERPAKATGENQGDLYARRGCAAGGGDDDGERCESCWCQSYVENWEWEMCQTKMVSFQRY